MFTIMDKIRLPSDLGKALAQYREENKLSAVGVASSAGRSRTVLHKLERGQDVTLASLFDILRAMGLCLSLQKAGMPTLEEMQRRFADDDEDGANAA
jgi:DNA-binding phage protein